MQIVLRILKEIGIAILLLGILFALGMFLFRSQIPFLSVNIPDAVSYPGIAMSDYDIKGDLEDETDPTRTYTASNSSLREMEKEYLVLTGAANPFSSRGDGSKDIPTETVTISNAASSESSAVSISESSEETQADAGTTQSESASTGEQGKSLE